MSTLKYRPEIDGLRALAVVAVILYHSSVPGFSGGFVGVDVFFVISGFLISGIILKQGDQFRFLEFYRRRVLRLAPALYACLLGTVAVGVVLLLPADLVRLVESALSGLAFSSNVYFWSNSDYFAPVAEDQPLLHTWSLGVEEQFYLFAPSLLVLMRRRRWPVAPMLLLAIALSLTLSCLLVYRYRQATFFLLPTRAWELLLGAWLASSQLKPMRRPGLVALAGVVLILAPVALYDARTVFPGWAAAPPAVGTALLIHAMREHESLVRRCLASAPTVFIGKISYSLYLWHWPVVAYLHYVAPTLREEWFYAPSVVAVSVLLGWGAWRWVETPMRRLEQPPLRVFATFAVCTGMVAAGGLWLRATGGLPSRLSPEVAALSHVSRSSEYRACSDGVCVVGDPSAEPSVLLLGDSHAHVLVDVLNDIGNAEHFSVEVRTRGCPPVPGVELEYLPRGCDNWSRGALGILDESPAIQVVVVAARWNWYVHEPGDDCLEDCWPPRTIQRMSDGLTGIPALESSARLLADRVAPRRLILVRQAPTQSVMVTRALAKSMFLGVGGRPSGVARAIVDARHRPVNDVLSGRLGSHVRVIDPIEILCDSEVCPALAESTGLPLYSDDDHLSREGTMRLMPALRTALSESGESN